MSRVLGKSAGTRRKEETPCRRGVGKAAFLGYRRRGGIARLDPVPTPTHVTARAKHPASDLASRP